MALTRPQKLTRSTSRYEPTAAESVRILLEIYRFNRQQVDIYSCTTICAEYHSRPYICPKETDPDHVDRML